MFVLAVLAIIAFVVAAFLYTGAVREINRLQKVLVKDPPAFHLSDLQALGDVITGPAAGAVLTAVLKHMGTENFVSADARAFCVQLEKNRTFLRHHIGTAKTQIAELEAGIRSDEASIASQEAKEAEVVKLVANVVG